VLINPGYIYAPNDARHIRLSFAYSSGEDVKKGLEILYQEVKRILKDR